MRYTKEFKEAIIQKILSNPDRTVVSFAREASIPDSTVATWIRNHTKKTGKRLNSKKSKKQWSAENKFEAVLETSALSEAEKSEYCRKHGIYPDQLKEWKQNCISGCRKSPDREYLKKAKQREQELKRKAQSLEKELNRKEKALAETAALLVLKKKVQELWGEQEDD